ncbi:MAG: hypothetical protein J6X49_19830 [Victivallales bacterium]|nr:hypothetical protein [Victivallales bacterium]
MGVYLNRGNGLFKEALNGQIYVDKSKMIRSAAPAAPNFKHHGCRMLRA